MKKRRVNRRSATTAKRARQLLLDQTPALLRSTMLSLFHRRDASTNCGEFRMERTVVWTCTRLRLQDDVCEHMSY